MGCRDRIECVGCLDAVERMDDVLLVIILERVGRPLSGVVVTEGVGVEAPSWSSSSPSASFSLARSSAECVEVVFTDGDLRCPTTRP